MRFEAIIFDMGNTLVRWGKAETRAFYAPIQEAMEAECGPIADFNDRAWKVRGELIEKHADTDMRENTVTEFVDAMLDGNAPGGLADRVTDAIERTFVDVVTVPDGLHELLDTLSRRMPLAVLSNFLLTRPIEDVIRHNGLWDYFTHVEVSATTGWCKPHPEPFEIVKNKLGTPMERTLMVGDEFWADIVGGHRAGLQTALTHQHRQDVTQDPRAPDVRADRILQGIHELVE